MASTGTSGQECCQQPHSYLLKTKHCPAVRPALSTDRQQKLFSNKNTNELEKGVTGTVHML